LQDRSFTNIPEKEMEKLVLPLRPTLKALYPLTPMDEYIQLIDTKGRVLDPWIRN
jgi:hypothetical protein